jgi:hypothetical protein
LAQLIADGRVLGLEIEEGNFQRCPPSNARLAERDLAPAARGLQDRERSLRDGH